MPPNTSTPHHSSQELVQASGTTTCSPQITPTYRSSSNDQRLKELEARNLSLQDAFQQLTSKYNEDKRHWKEWKRAEELKAERKKQKKARMSDMAEQSPAFHLKKSPPPQVHADHDASDDELASGEEVPQKANSQPAAGPSTSPTVDRTSDWLGADARAFVSPRKDRIEQRQPDDPRSPSHAFVEQHLHDHSVPALPSPELPEQPMGEPTGNKSEVSPEQRAAHRRRLSRLPAEEKQTIYAPYKGKGRYLPPEAVWVCCFEIRSADT